MQGLPLPRQVGEHFHAPSGTDALDAAQFTKTAGPAGFSAWHHDPVILRLALWSPAVDLQAPHLFIHRIESQL